MSDLALKETGSWSQVPKEPEGRTGTGAPGKHYWTYRTINTGSTSIEL